MIAVLKMKFFKAYAAGKDISDGWLCLAAGSAFRHMEQAIKQMLKRYLQKMVRLLAEENMAKSGRSTANFFCFVSSCLSVCCAGNF